MDNILEVFYGGAAGGGKSFALLAAALQYVDVPGYSALILRKTYSDLSLPGALMDVAFGLLGDTDAKFNRDTKTWTFPSGATLSFGFLETDKDKYRYAGAAFQYISFDELTQFEESSYRFLFSRLRKPNTLDVPLRMRSASNPGGIGHEWVRQYFLEEKSPQKVFLPAKMVENPFLDQKSYLDSMNRLPTLEREQLLNGNWEIRPFGGLFRRHWFSIVEDYPREMNIVVRYWDLSATVTGDYTVGIKMGEFNGQYWIIDIQRIRATPMVVQQLVKQTAEMDGKSVHIYMEQEPGSSGLNNIDHYARNVLQGYIYKGDRPTGDKFVRALPVSSAAEHGNIKILRGRYISSFLDELEAFPQTEHDDQVDALSGAFHAIQDIKASGIVQIGKIDFMIGGQDGKGMSNKKSRPFSSSQSLDYSEVL